MTPISYLLLSTFVLSAVTAWTISSLLYPLSRSLSRYPTRFSSNFWFSLGIFPVITGIIIASVALSSAWMSFRQWIPDHCVEHGGHPHLCLAHIAKLPPGGLGFWLVFLVAGTLMAYSLASLVRANRGAMPKVVLGDRDGYHSYPSSIPAAFTAGFFAPRAYLTTAADRLLSRQEKAVILAHEREHTRRRDPLRLCVLQFLERFLPGGRYIRSQWQISVELDCDEAALREGFSRHQVASTILKLQRATRSYLQPSGSLQYASPQSGEFLRLRVESLVLGGDRKTVGLKPTVAASIILWLGCGVFLIEVHHLLETVLGWLA